VKDFDLITAIAEHRAAIDGVADMEAALRRAVMLIRDAFAAGRRLFACGNGGSAADAQHLAAELTGRFEKERRGYPATALSTDTSALTSIGNDYGFDHIFARQLQALATRGDVLVAISTSGNSPNIVKAVEQARALGVRTIGLLGRDGGACAELVDVPLVVGVPRTARIQEAHVLILHLLCEALDA
jgi:D-sedoheptulose 7-phosphate isomerase